MEQHKMKRPKMVREGNRALAYARVSTEDQAREGISLDAQESRAMDYCTHLGLELAAVIRDEGVSGTVPMAERPGGAELVRRLETGDVAHLVTMALDRLSRDVVEVHARIREWTKTGIAVHFTNGGQVDMASATGRAHVGMQSVMAAWWRDVIAERTREALARKRQKGEWIGRPPAGYRIDGTRLVPDSKGSQDRALRARARELRAQGLSLARVADVLNAEGWRPLRGGRRFWDSTIRRMLTSALPE